MKTKNQNVLQYTKLLRVTSLFLLLLSSATFLVKAQQPQTSPTSVNQNNDAKKVVILTFKDTDKMF